MATYEVTAPAAVVTDPAGKVHYFYAGSRLPEGTDTAQLTRLIGRGLISQVTEPTLESAESAGGEGTVERPAQVAAKSLWVDYVVSRGMDRVEAEAMTRQQLIDTFPSA